MAKAKRYSAGIIGTGMHVPPRIFTNKDMEKIVDTSDEWITEKIGIKERRFATPDLALSDLCIPAAKQAIRNAGIKPEDIDLIIVGAMSHDYLGIPTSNIIKDNIGAKNAVTIDLNVICAGFIYCIEIASKLISEGSYRNVLAINGEVFSRYGQSRVTSVIFGDGAGACVLSRVREGKGVIATYIDSNVKDATKLASLGGGSRYPSTVENIKKGLFTIQMDGPAIYSFATKVFPESVRKVLQKAGMRVSDIDFVISHQANIRIIKEGMKSLGMPMSKTYTNIHKYGNIGGGSVILALHEAVKKGLIKRNNVLVTVAFGAGLSWGACLMKWCGKEDVLCRSS